MVATVVPRGTIQRQKTKSCGGSRKVVGWQHFTQDKQQKKNCSLHTQAEGNGEESMRWGRGKTRQTREKIYVLFLRLASVAEIQKRNLIMLITCCEIERVIGKED